MAIRVSGAKLDFSPRDDSGEPDDVNLKDGEIDNVSVRAIFPRKKGVVKRGYMAVRIDSELLKEVEAFINLKKNKFKYANRKQFVDVAVADYLRRQRKKK